MFYLLSIRSIIIIICTVKPLFINNYYIPITITCFILLLMRFQCLYSIDYLSCQAKLTFNPKGDTRLKTRVGGCITLFAVIISIPLILYYIISIAFHSKKHIAFSTHHAPSSTVPHSYKLPFLFRLINANGQTVNSNFYHITASYNYKNKSDTPLHHEHNRALQVERCSKSEHLNMFEHLFEQMSENEAKEYYCLGLRGSDVSIGGEYKVSDSYSYYQFNVTYDNEYNTSNADNNVIVEEGLSLEIKTLDYTIDNDKQLDMAEGFIHTERLLISDSFIKNIYIHLKQILYIDDTGIIFNRTTYTKFHKIDSVKHDFVPKQLPSHSHKHQLLISVVVLSRGNSLTIYRSYLKLDEALVFINGILRYVWGFAHIVNYFYSHNYYYMKLLNDFLLVEESKEIIQKRRNYALADFTRKTIMPSNPSTLVPLINNKNLLFPNGIACMNNGSSSKNLPCMNNNNNSCYVVNQHVSVEKDNALNLSGNTFTKFNTLHNFLNNNNITHGASDSENYQAPKHANQEDNFIVEGDNNKNMRNLAAYRKYAVYSSSQNKESLKFKQYKLFIPMRFWMITKANQKMFNTYIEQLNSKLNIVSILKKLETNNALEQLVKQTNKRMKEDEMVNLNISRLQRHNSKNKGLVIKTPRAQLDGCMSPQVGQNKKNLLLKQSGTIGANSSIVKSNLEE